MKQSFKLLGGQLKNFREKFHESLAEVSGALEIDIDILNSIEKGEERPNEDTLSLLIAHFAVKEEEAKKLWELAGYGQQKQTDTSQNPAQPLAFVMPMDARIVYTDMVHVMSNNYGMIMNFMQSAGPNNQPLAVARVGMSREHALSVMELLKRTLDQQVRALPAPKNNDSEKDHKVE